MFKKFLLIPLLAATASAQIESQLVITETSSTSLTATFNGSDLPVTPLSSDRWRIGVAIFGGGYGAFTTPEPENAALVNVIVPVESDGQPYLIVASDYQLGVTGNLSSYTAEQDEVPFLDGIDANGNSIMVTFDDDAATAEASVPDAASTAGLLMLSALALCGVSRLAFANELKPVRRAT